MITPNFELYLKMPTEQAARLMASGDSQAQGEALFEKLVEVIAAGTMQPMPESVTLLGPNGRIARWQPPKPPDGAA